MEHSTDSTVFLNAGWPKSMPTMDGPGRRWWVTAFLTSAADYVGVRPGDRVLIRGRPEDFLSGASSLDVVEQLVAQGHDVRRSEPLHAKMYLRESDNGSAIGWIGSANLTHAGRSNARWNSNYEVMAGPLPFSRKVIAELKALWSSAVAVDAAYLERVRQAMGHGPDWTGVGGFLVVHLDVRTPAGAFKIPLRWFVDWSAWNGVVTSVRYLTTPATTQQGLAGVRKAVTAGFAKWFGERTGARGEFVIESRDQVLVEAALKEARRLVDKLLPIHATEDLDAALTDFVGRAMVVVRTQATSRRLKVADEEIARELSEAFQRHVAAKPSQVAYTILAPVSEPEGALAEAIVRLRTRPRKLFERDGEASLHSYLSALRLEVERSGLSAGGR
jgi:hypothetical protein